ncbi:MAG: carbamoyltransferase HypF [Dehalococcoidales bacterium]
MTELSLAKAGVRSVKVDIHGVVQGVGFRPFIYQLAKQNNLNGWVRNTSGNVEVEVEGEAEAVQNFLSGLKSKAPPMARIEGMQVLDQPPVGYRAFEIRASQAREGRYQLISPDVATCQACQKEILDPMDRRYRYPFTNCTNCGPRFTIITDIPYDRPRTTMSCFQMCPQCQQEYDDPLDRRFHAQPNACAVCGPSLEVVDRQGNSLTGGDALAIASQLLKEGHILAVKGLGGFLIACDATSHHAVRRLRERKRRAAKPLAVMFSTLVDVRKHCYVSAEEESLLLSPQSPIVLLRWRDGSDVSSEVAPGLKYLGVMLPYTPLHHLLLRETGLPLVMTSGNLSEEPIAKDNEEALRRLGRIADYFLVHNRGIFARYDDSVAMVEAGKPRLVRRARGYAPHPIHLPFRAKQILACGTELKNTFCLTRDEYAFLSQHIGDMENLETLEHFETTIELYQKLFRVQPRIVAHDLHPDYLATKYAREMAAAAPELRLCPVQHHHAHIASCLAENGVNEPAIGVALDGTGYGTDGHIWGGEFLLVDYKGFRRLGHFQYVPLPGAEAAIKRPYRMAISYLYTLLGERFLDGDLPFLAEIDPLELELVRRQIQRAFNSPLTSSCGRLFDAVSGLIGVRGTIDYEAQAAIDLEMLATNASPCQKGAYPFDLTEENGMSIVQFGETFSAIISDVKRGVSKAEISLRFHNTVAEMVACLCRCQAKKTGISKVALSGGVFQNRVLLRLTLAALDRVGLVPVIHSQVPPNDGGVSLGQAVIANLAAD